MPTILTPQGWVKVDKPAPRKRVVTQDPKVALRGPLAYFAGQRARPADIPIPNIKGKSPFPYDLSASPEKLKRQNHTNAQRTVSAPVMHGALHHDSEDDEPQYDAGLRSPKSDKARSKHKSSRHNDDAHSVASSSSSSSSTNSASRSYTRHRPVEARPRPPPAPAPNHYYSSPRYDHYAAPPPMAMHMPMPPTTGRNLSYSWYNATTPLNIT